MGYPFCHITGGVEGKFRDNRGVFLMSCYNCIQINLEMKKH